jgi:uncharacterized protein (UPF0332 family)
MQKAREFLDKAEELLNRNRWPEDAGRSAYLAGFHGAQAFLFEKEDKVFKTHKEVQGEFGRIVKNDPRFDVELRAFLGRAYDLKAIADYESGPDAKVTDERAARAIATARRFVAAIEALLRA